MKIKSVQTVDIKEVGTINLAGVEANSGQISVHIPVSTDNKDFIKLIDSLEEDFHSKHPEVLQWYTALVVMRQAAKLILL